MASSAEYLNYVLDQFSGLNDISYRPMMGEFILYYQGKIIGGIYDDRFLVKKTASSLRMMPDAESVSPYSGAKEMLTGDIVDDRELLCRMVKEMYDELPAVRRRK
ncbi:MAG: TfoX/Sxy family protein [Erysipelotrichaceae bacterium]|nr:TfoX/Sxy family protein [Erysipelotrichaceae bacterium]